MFCDNSYTKRSILDVAAALDPPLKPQYLNTFNNSEPFLNRLVDTCVICCVFVKAWLAIKQVKWGLISSASWVSKDFKIYERGKSRIKNGIFTDGWAICPHTRKKQKTKEKYLKIAWGYRLVSSSNSGQNLYKADVKVFWSCPVTLALYTFRDFFVTDFVATAFPFEIFSLKHTKKRFPKLEYARIDSIFSVALEFWQYAARSVLKIGVVAKTWSKTISFY